MVGIVGILLLGSLAWSAVGALLGALGEATAVFTSARATPTKLVAVVSTATGTPSPRATPRSTSTVAPTASAAPTLMLEPTASAEATSALTPTPAASGRAPWVLLPQPAPDSRVPPGQLTVEVRGRGDAPITAIRLELDGASLSVSLEQRSESTWRGSASTQVSAGHHAVRATVVDDQNRSGSYRWTFDAG
jgi:hypothetical protein